MKALAKIPRIATEDRGSFEQDLQRFLSGPAFMRRLMNDETQFIDQRRTRDRHPSARYLDDGHPSTRKEPDTVGARLRIRSCCSASSGWLLFNNQGEGAQRRGQGRWHCQDEDIEEPPPQGRPFTDSAAENPMAKYWVRTLHPAGGWIASASR